MCIVYYFVEQISRNKRGYNRPMLTDIYEMG